MRVERNDVMSENWPKKLEYQNLVIARLRALQKCFENGVLMQDAQLISRLLLDLEDHCIKGTFIKAKVFAEPRPHSSQG
jgi:hypothetical protein